ncbi:MAG TPA: potassium channel family protein, partial [Ilumatobacteraceae bacterium]|nr:potassium channel family protein [Ilumatobacteraceae bacterium]
MVTLAVIVGLSLVVIVLVDVAWTAIAAGSGAGPLTSRVAGGLWGAALAVHRRRSSHRLLTVMGVVIVFAVLAVWIALILTGWSLVFGVAPGAVRDASSTSPADTVDRLYFVGYTVFTLGTGDFVPGEGTWQLATVVATGTGLVMITMSITYLVPVAAAAADRRELAAYIWSLGSSPTEIVRTGWDGSGFDGLSEHFVELTTRLTTLRQQHLTYPIVHYFHSGNEANSAAPNVANLAQVLHVLDHGVDPSVRMRASIQRPLERALDAYLDTLGENRVSTEEPLEPQPLDRISELGVPTVA